VPSIKAIRETKDGLEVDFHLPDTSKAASLGCTVLSASKETGNVRLAIPKANMTSAQAIAAINATIAGHVDWEIRLIDGQPVIQNIPVKEVPDPDAKVK